MNGRNLAALAVLTIGSARTSSPGGPHSNVYTACKEAVFHDALGLEPSGRDSVIWPKLGGRSVVFVGGGRRYTVTIRHVTVDAGGQNSNAVVD